MSRLLMVGSPEHKHLFCAFFMETHVAFDPATVTWPALDAESLQRLHSLPVWHDAVETARPFLAGTAVLSLIVVGIALGILLRQATHLITVASEQRSGNGLPIVVLAPFTVAGSPSPGAISATALQEKMRDAFVRFESVNIVTASKEVAGDARARCVGER